MDPDALWATNVVDSGSEVLVRLEQTLCSTFPKLVPDQSKTASVDKARPVFEAFVARLKHGYQDEMVVTAPIDSPSMRLEMVLEGAGVFELGTQPEPMALAEAA